MSQLDISAIYELDQDGKKTIVVKHFPPNIDVEHLQSYLELHVFGVEHVTLVLPHPGCNVAVASLDGDVSVSDACLATYQGNVFSKPIKRNCYPELAMLGSLAGVYLEDVPECVDSSDITSYFERFAIVDDVKRAVAGNLQYFAVTIADICAVHSLISKNNCCICGQNLFIQPYYPTVHGHILDYVRQEADENNESESFTKEDWDEVNQPEIHTEVHSEMLPGANILQANTVVDDSSNETDNSSSNPRLVKSTPNVQPLVIIDAHSDIRIQPMTMHVGHGFTKAIDNACDYNLGDTVSVSPNQSPKFHAPNVAAVKPFYIREASHENDSSNEHDKEGETVSRLWSSKADQSKYDEEDWKETEKFEQPAYEIDTDDELKGATGGYQSEETDDAFEKLQEVPKRPVRRYRGKQHQIARLQGDLDEKAAMEQALSLSMQDGSKPVYGSNNPRPERQSKGYGTNTKRFTTTHAKSRIRREELNGVSVKLMKGEIAKHKADVLVNVVSDSDQDPFNTMVAKSFLKVGGQDLLQGFQMAQMFRTSQAQEVTSTSSTGHLQCTTVLHVTIEKGSDCKQVVDSAMVQILDVCEKSGRTTVAIPPIGVGRMFKFPTPVVAKRMLEQVYVESRRRISLKKVTIIIYDDDTFDTFDHALSAIASKDRTNHLSRTQHPHTKSSHGHQRAQGQHQSSQPPRHSQRDRRDQDSDRNHVHSAQRNNVRGGFEKPTKTNPDAYIQKMASETDPEVPKYWNNYKPGTSITQLLVKPIKNFFGHKHEKVKLMSDTPEYTEIIKMMNKTFDHHKVGAGNDAKNIPQGSYQRLKVLKIERIENFELYEKFAAKRKSCYRTLLKSRAHTYPVIKDLPNCKGAPVTSSYCQGVLDRDMHSNINEYLFFHGTKLDLIDVVCNNGLEPKLGNKDAMLGQGIYGAEQSTKADQYTDYEDKRSFGQGNGKKMFLIRMILGNSYVSSDKNPHKYKQPPCTKCYRDDCKTAGHGKGKFGHFFHSVIGENDKLFREFVVYDGDLCYPEYLISYERL